MRRKIALVIAAASLSIPVGAAVAGSPAFASTRAQSVSVDKQHKESVDASKDTAKEGSTTDKSKDSTQEGSNTETSKDVSKEGSSTDKSKDSTQDGSSNGTPDSSSVDAAASASRTAR
jgi:hypothetical protein